MGKATNKYPLPRIVDELMAKYELTGPNDTEEQKKLVRENLYRAIKGICEKTPAEYGSRKTLWEATKTPSSPSKEGKSTKPRYKFTEKQKHQLLDSLELKKYLSARTRSDKCKKELEEDIQIYEQNTEEAKAQVAAAKEALKNFDPDEQRKKDAEAAMLEGYQVTSDEAHRAKMEMMLEALYLQFFEPVDMDAWKADMNCVLTTEPTDQRAASVAASKRLQDISNYCKPKDPGKN